jgi:NAD(P)-dependent dehydrogenase (short-subunit alcohol dehydrogenase family)
MSKKVLPYMMERKQGSIVHISSVHAWQTSPSFTAYAAAKGGIVAMARSMALECAPFGIRVNTVLPGLTRNSGIDKRTSQLSAEERLVQLQKLAHNIPIGRIAEPQDIGEAVVFIASARASFITGACLAVDGGETIHLQF